MYITLRHRFPYSLASDPIKLIAKRRGDVPDEKIVMSGLPIRYDFAIQADALDDRTTKEGKAHRAKVREQLNIDTKKKMILVMGGGEGVGSLSDIVNELYAKLRTQGVDATICVVCGRNEKLFSELQTRSWDSVVSFSSDVPFSHPYLILLLLMSILLYRYPKASNLMSL